MSLREIIWNNFGWKVASFVLATLVWFTIHDVIQHAVPILPPSVSTTIHTLPPHSITVMTAAADSRGFSVTPSETVVTLSGPASSLEKVSARDVQVFVDLTDVQDVKDLVQKIQVYPPPGLKVLDVTPGSVRVVRSGEPRKP